MATRVSASKARAHTRRKDPATMSPWLLLSKVWDKALLLLIAILCYWMAMAVRPPPSRVCGTEGGPPVTVPRFKLSDGRHMAYKEGGVAKELSRCRIVVAHAYTRSRHDLFPASKDVMETLGVYVVSYDRPGYGQSDPNPMRSPRSEAKDIEELADFLELGNKFYVISNSLGAHAAWGCIHYIRHRLAGVAMVTPVVNHWWPSLAATPQGKAIFNSKPLGDRLFLSVAHYAPWFSYWMMTQKLLPTSSTVNPKKEAMCESDWEIRSLTRKRADPALMRESVQQGVAESLNRDTAVMFGDWGFDPFAMEEAPSFDVHIWAGERDYLVPIELQRLVASKLRWVHYHEVAGKGHYLLGVPGLPDDILHALLAS